MPAERQNGLLFIIIIAQFAGTSLWFAGNAILDQIGLSDYAAITSIFQFGFIAGTLVFSLLTVADRFRSSRLFFVSALIAAGANLLLIWFHQTEAQVSVLRFITGFFLAGIYPVGMKIAADFFPQKLGKALGLLVGALVLGTAFPHLIRYHLDSLEWKTVLVVTSALAISGGLLILFLVPKSKLLPRPKKTDLLAAVNVFRSASFRSAAFGYFGHMWELYAFWTILPVLLSHHNLFVEEQANPYLWSFLVIGTGAAGCAIGGLLSQRFGSKAVAFYSLFLSGSCCLILPVIFETEIFFYSMLLLWGLTITADSPQFSALVAENATATHKGTALSIVTSIGFAITILSIQLLSVSFLAFKENSLWLLAIGPGLGLLALKKPT